MARLPWVLAGLIAAGIIHILVVFAIPGLASRDAWGRLSAAVKPNTLAIADGKTVPRLPFTSPDVATAYCLFDLSKGNLVVKSPLLDAAWSLTLSTRSGDKQINTSCPTLKPLPTTRGTISSSVVPG